MDLGWGLDHDRRDIARARTQCHAGARACPGVHSGRTRGGYRLELLSVFHRRSALRKGLLQTALLLLAVVVFMGAGDDSARFKDLGHRLMCACGCRQILLECNHVGCSYSERMRGELIAAVDRGDSDDLTLQAFVQKYGPTVLAAPTKSGFNWVAWVAPYLALALGLLWVGYVARVWRSRPLLQPVDLPVPVHGVELERFREQVRKETEV
jgi:cytochrome c-type biogenesis protein CcmH/NrfF